MNLMPFERIIQRINPAFRLKSAESMTGGVSAQVTKLEIVRPDGHLIKLHGQNVMEQFTAHYLEHNPIDASASSYWELL